MVHERNLQILATEMYKILNSLSPEVMKDFSKLKLITFNAFIRSKKNVKTIRYGLQTMSYMGPKIWDLAPKEMKEVITLNEFKAKIHIWKLENCPYRLSRYYLPQIGFIT